MQCENRHCYGIVKQYKEGGPREMPDKLKQEQKNWVLQLKLFLYSLIGKEKETITWYECSMCHEYYPDMSE